MLTSLFWAILIWQQAQPQVVTVDTMVTKGFFPLYFRDGNRELFVCTAIKHIKDEDWNIVGAANCKLDKGVSLDDVASGIIEMNRSLQRKP